MYTNACEFFFIIVTFSIRSLNVCVFNPQSTECMRSSLAGVSQVNSGLMEIDQNIQPIEESQRIRSPESNTSLFNLVNVSKQIKRSQNVRLLDSNMPLVESSLSSKVLSNANGKCQMSFPVLFPILHIPFFTPYSSYFVTLNILVIRMYAVYIAYILFRVMYTYIGGGLILSGHLHGTEHHCVNRFGLRPRCPGCEMIFASMASLRDHLMATQKSIVRLHSPDVHRLKSSTMSISTFMGQIDPGNAFHRTPMDVSHSVSTDGDHAASIIADVKQNAGNTEIDSEIDSEIESHGAPYTALLVCKLEKENPNVMNDDNSNVTNDDNPSEENSNEENSNEITIRERKSMLCSVCTHISLKISRSLLADVVSHYLQTFWFLFANVVSHYLKTFLHHPKTSTNIPKIFSYLLYSFIFHMNFHICSISVPR